MPQLCCTVSVYIIYILLLVQVPVSCVEFVRPKPGDFVRIIQGPFTGVTGWLHSTHGSLFNIQLINGAYAQVVESGIAKLALETGTPVVTPSSLHPPPSPTSPTAASPLFSPSSLSNGQFPPFPSPLSSYPPSPTHSYISGFTVPGPLRVTPAYTHAPYPRQLRRTVPANGTPLSNPAMADNFHRRRPVVEQHRDLASQQRRLVGLHGNTLNGSRVLQQVSNIGSSGGGGGGKMQRGDQEYKNLVRYLERPTQDILEEVRERKMREYDFGSTGAYSSCIPWCKCCMWTGRIF